MKLRLATAVRFLVLPGTKSCMAVASLNIPNFCPTWDKKNAASGRASCRRRVLNAVLVLLVAAGLPAMAASDTNEWQSLEKAMEEFNNAEPPEGLSSADFDRMIREGRRKAVVLADKFEDFYRRNSDGQFAEEAWENWLDLLNIGAVADSKVLARLERIEKENLQDSKLSLERRIYIHGNRIDRASDATERERL